MGNRLDAKYTFAFAIDLEGQLAAVQLEDCQIIGSSLDRDFPFRRSLGASAINRAVLISKNCFDGLQIETHAAAVDERLKDLSYVSTDRKDQVSTVFDLVIGILATQPASLLLIEVEREAQAGTPGSIALQPEGRTRCLRSSRSPQNRREK